MNKAIALNPNATYSLVFQQKTQTIFIVGTNLVNSVLEKFGINKEECVFMENSYHASHFIKNSEMFQVCHPLFEDGVYISIILDDVVSVKLGTGCLHLAPGCGLEDYLIGVKNGLDLYSPISPDGTFTQEIIAAFPSLPNLRLEEANDIVISLLGHHKRLIHQSTTVHLLPHCWRCNTDLSQVLFC